MTPHRRNLREMRERSGKKYKSQSFYIRELYLLMEQAAD